MIDFSNLLNDDADNVIDPREIFITLNRDKRFAFPRDIQTEVLNAWFAVRNQSDIIIKLNVGSGKTVVGLLILQSSINEHKKLTWVSLVRISEEAARPKLKQYLPFGCVFHSKAATHYTTKLPSISHESCLPLHGKTATPREVDRRHV